MPNMRREILTSKFLEILNERPFIEGFVEYTGVTIKPEYHQIIIYGVDSDGFRKVGNYYSDCKSETCGITNTEGYEVSPFIDDILDMMPTVIEKENKIITEESNLKLVDQLKEIIGSEFKRKPSDYIGKVFSTNNLETGKPTSYGSIVLVTKLIDDRFPMEFKGIRLDYDNEMEYITFNQLYLHEEQACFKDEFNL